MKRKAVLVTPIYILVALFIIGQHRLALAVTRSNTLNAQADIQSSLTIEKARKIPKVYSDVPESLYIPRLGLNLQIGAGMYDIPSKSWTLSKDKAHFAAQTQPANNVSGLTLIYGHNTPAVFKKTSGLVKGDVIEIRTVNSLVFSYAFVDDLVVMPTDTSVFEYRGKPRLSLLACTGTWSESRRIMNFELVSVRKAS